MLLSGKIGEPVHKGSISGLRILTILLKKDLKLLG